MMIDLTDIARGRRIVALAARDMLSRRRHPRPVQDMLTRTLRRLRLSF
ncbi:hypothetical protein ACFSDD_04340 [Salipiger marinus]|jgi:hypothetical protein|uniref:Uncharacterized protein n=1 Tax=Salipiger marinus TaxID=555512 RepID=A0A1G8HWL9_9RHOB|nr:MULTISPECIES: hypothetical protein [Salipiger]MCD1616992.1 hypothetical protein [Salipiger manganoxidans]MEB3417040.1 hypothetical protein [Salipiger manganoxidans]SDI11125.1 hypothetical protein SAMN04487993_100191 [Salipiger marinus]|tara:strand:- start:209 stop:352 length:144 start_codon:yes stop_codon:yes gene_type:complete